MGADADGLHVTLDGTRVEVRGELDASTADELSRWLDPLPPGDGDVTLLLAGVPFVDSRGLRVLIEAHQRAAAAGRRLVLAAPTATVRRMFDIAGVADYLHLVER